MLLPIDIDKTAGSPQQAMSIMENGEVETHLTTSESQPHQKNGEAKKYHENMNTGFHHSIRETWYFPSDIANDLQDVDLPAKVKREIKAMSFEYARSVIPQYTNWSRYVAFMRIFIIGIITEFSGDLVEVTSGNQILGYDLQSVLDALFEGTTGHETMCREYRSFLLITGEKTSKRRDGELFRRYVDALAYSPRQWFRMRDADALARFTIAAALACNDLDHIWFSNEQLEILTELGDTLYDAVAFFKHRSEGETNSTFSYVPSNMRTQAFHQAREVLFALDVAFARQPDLAVVTSFVRYFGGPLFMMMRRYRFVEEGLTIGKSENDEVIAQTRQNYKLWNRIEARQVKGSNLERYRACLAQKEKIMFDGLAEMLESNEHCPECQFRDAYGAEMSHSFGGVQLCDACKERWGTYVADFPARAAVAFPQLREIFSRAQLGE